MQESYDILIKSWPWITVWPKKKGLCQDDLFYCTSCILIFFLLRQLTRRRLKISFCVTSYEKWKRATSLRVPLIIRWFMVYYGFATAYLNTEWQATTLWLQMNGCCLAELCFTFGQISQNYDPDLFEPKDTDSFKSFLKSRRNEEHFNGSAGNMLANYSFTVYVWFFLVFLFLRVPLSSRDHKWIHHQKT